MTHHVPRKTVPGIASSSGPLPITPIPRETPASPASSDSYTSPQQSLISRRPSHDETNQGEPRPRDSLVSRRSSDEGTVQADNHPRQSHLDYSSLLGDPPPDPKPRLQPSQPARRSPTPPPKYVTRMLENLGWWPATLVVLCLVLLAASAGFLSWIWFAHRENTRWRNLMLGPLGNVAVTITTFVVRLSIAGITWVTVAMMASVIVERHGVPEEKMAEASMVRYSGSIISLVLDGFTLKTSWFRILVPLQVICTVLSQLSSSLLFSDFQNVQLHGFPVGTGVKYDFDTSVFGNRTTRIMNPVQAFSQEWNQFQPSTFEPFAEHSKPKEKIDNDMVDDTGPVWRAFLPLSAYDNNNIQEYNGVARVFDARTICVRPDIQDFRLEEDYITGDGHLKWAGNVRIDASSVPDVLNVDDDGFFEENFACSFDARMTFVTTTWMQCELESGHSEHRRIPTLDPLFYNRSAIDDLLAEWAAGGNGTNAYIYDSPEFRITQTRAGQAHILLEVDYEQADWYEWILWSMLDRDIEEMDVLNMSIASSMGEGPWSSVEMKVDDDLNDLTKHVNMTGWNSTRKRLPLRATYCWDVMSHGNSPTQYLNINATSEAVLSAPVTSWNESASKYVTEDVRSQLGVTTNSPSLQDRAVFTLTQKSLDHAIDHEVKPADVASYTTVRDAETEDEHAYRTYLAKTTLVSFDSYNDGGRTQRFWTNLLTDILEDTGSPALAVQAINTAASRMIYTNWKGSFTTGAQSQVAYHTDFRIPVAVAGYAAVMSVIAAQIALLVVVGAMFRSCANSVLNDAWLVMSHVSSSPGAVGTLVREKGVTDADVARFVGEAGSGGVRRRLTVRDGAFREPDKV